MGATVDLKILYHLMECEYDFCMELTHKERQDNQGGHLVVHNSKLLLLEARSLPRVARDKLQRDTRFTRFNTNNLWVNLRSLQSHIATERSVNLPVIIRERQIEM